MGESTKCGQPECDRNVAARGLCLMHYKRAKKMRCLPAKMPKPCCSVEGCNRKYESAGFCQMHRARMRRHGDPQALKQAAEGAGLSFLVALKGYNEDDCVIWPYSCASNGYGQTFFCGEVMGAHRVMCILEYGAPPDAKLHAAHSCGRGEDGCVNPKHLRWATPLENIADKKIHGTQRMGQDCPSAKLKEHEVIEIIDLPSSMSSQKVAQKYGVHALTINRIRRGLTWRHIPRH